MSQKSFYLKMYIDKIDTVLNKKKKNIKQI